MSGFSSLPMLRGQGWALVKAVAGRADAAG